MVLVAVFVQAARLACVASRHAEPPSFEQVLELSGFFATVASAAHSRFLGLKTFPFVDPFEFAELRSVDAQSPTASTVAAQLTKICDRREIQQKLVVARERMVAQLALCGHGPPFTREAFEKYHAPLINQFDMCVYAPVNKGADHCEFKRFVWPAIEYSTLKCVADSLGKDSAAWIAAAISFWDDGVASTPRILRLSDGWSANKTQYASLFEALAATCKVVSREKHLGVQTDDLEPAPPDLMTALGIPEPSGLDLQPDLVL